MRALLLAVFIGGAGAGAPIIGGRSIPMAAERATRGGRPDTLRVDAAGSTVRWKGTKFGGRGSHSGTLKLREGELILAHGTVLGGSFVVEMRSLEVADIPVTDPVPREKLRRHLLGADFFDVPKWPTAHFRATGSVRTGERSYRLRGLMTMHGVEHDLALDVTVRSLENATLVADGHVVFDRHDWGLSYKGSALTNDLLDDDVTLDVRLVARRGR